MSGEGPRWQAIEAVFATHCRRLGLDDRRSAGRDEPEAPRTSTFRRPDPQGTLF
jgi:hypothetical protein